MFSHGEIKKIYLGINIFEELVRYDDKFANVFTP